MPPTVFFLFAVQFLCLKMCVCGGSAIPQGWVGDCHLAIVPHAVAEDRLPWAWGRTRGGGGLARGHAGVMHRCTSYLSRLPPYTHTYLYFVLMACPPPIHTPFDHRFPGHSMAFRSLLHLKRGPAEQHCPTPFGWGRGQGVERAQWDGPLIGQFPNRCPAYRNSLRGMQPPSVFCQRGHCMLWGRNISAVPRQSGGVPAKGYC